MHFPAGVKLSLAAREDSGTSDFHKVATYVAKFIAPLEVMLLRDKALVTAQ